MAQINFPTLNTKDKNIQLIQDNIQKLGAAIQSSPFQGGNYLTGVALISGTTQIAHKLGRTPVIWVIGDNTAAATIYRASWDSNFINLVSDAACTVALWVN